MPALPERPMSERTMWIDDVPVPRFLYGTAWKEAATQQLVEQALLHGFRGIDTANQRRHYDEAAVGAAVAAAIARGLVSRGHLFLQTKFTFRRGQDHRLPYDPAASIATQVRQSFASSLEHLQTEFVPSFVLHGPSVRHGLAADDWDAWRAMEAIHQQGQVRWLGVSNVALDQLKLLVEGCRVRPQFVQNRCHASQGWDRVVREFCKQQGIVYQGFSLLTANRDVLAHAELGRIARSYGRTPSQIIFRFALEVGMIPLTGTTSATHMREDLEVFDFQLEPDEVALIEQLGVDSHDK
jgi:diketogulonate reductase-like aldo/keto reductase